MSLRRWSPPPSPPHRSNNLTFSLSNSDSDIPDLDLLTNSLDDPRCCRRIPAQAYLRCLIHHLAIGDDHPLSFPIPIQGPSPAPKSSIDALPTIQISDPPSFALSARMSSPSTLTLASSPVPSSTTPTASSPGSPSTTLALSATSASGMTTPPLSPTTAGPACLSDSGVSLLRMMRLMVAGCWPSGMPSTFQEEAPPGAIGVALGIRGGGGIPHKDDAG